eukprot:879930-Pleurochrysis_carterae.AAC.4
MDGDAGDRPSPSPSASAKRSLRTAIDGTPDRPERGRSRGNDGGPERPDSNSLSDKFGTDVDSTRRGAEPLL